MMNFFLKSLTEHDFLNVNWEFFVKRALQFSLELNSFLFIKTVSLFKVREVPHGRGYTETNLNTRSLVVYKSLQFNEEKFTIAIIVLI
jgi:hypothetical protein